MSSLSTDFCLLAQLCWNQQQEVYFNKTTILKTHKKLSLEWILKIMEDIHPSPCEKKSMTKVRKMHVSSTNMSFVNRQHQDLIKKNTFRELYVPIWL